MILSGKLSECPRLIGCAPQQTESAALHDISIRRSADGLLVVWIRLFGCLGTPTYQVVVGRDRRL
jgi:hypothetical protein